VPGWYAKGTHKGRRTKDCLSVLRHGAAFYGKADQASTRQADHLIAMLQEVRSRHESLKEEAFPVSDWVAELGMQSCEGRQVLFAQADRFVSGGAADGLLHQTKFRHQGRYRYRVVVQV